MWEKWKLGPWVSFLDPKQQRSWKTALMDNRGSCKKYTASTLHCCTGSMPEHTAAWPMDKAGWEVVYRTALPSPISTKLSINFPDKLLTTAVLPFAFWSCFERSCMPSFFFFFLSVVPLQGQRKHFTTAASCYFKRGYGPCKYIKLDMQMRGPFLIWYFSVYLLFFFKLTTFWTISPFFVKRSVLWLLANKYYVENQMCLDCD